ncbi:MAG: glycosyltransferase [Actinomycetota bacterium]|nr:glycosyltransferase [Actinomycetota bacterium]MDP2289308.1 glycosyltransferase [Actinomycetota bacterium]
MMPKSTQLRSRPNFAHLLSLCDERGLFEHCDYDQPRREHGYCVDDVARALIVCEREQTTDAGLLKVMDMLSRFMVQAQQSDGRVINRCDVFGVWHGEASTDDHWGRALWCWGSVVRWDRSADRVREAYDCFAKSAALRSPHPRSMVFAGLGAIEFLRAYPSNTHAHALLDDALNSIPADLIPDQLWPEPRLTYASAALPELLIVGGDFFKQGFVVRRGLAMLKWLMDLQTRQGHLSVIPDSGWQLGDSLPAFDQQPIEVAALVDACASAFEVTKDQSWLEAIVLGARWFEGDNDTSARMYNPDTGAGFDGLTATGINLNCGAESTLAYLSVMQQANRERPIK